MQVGKIKAQGRTGGDVESKPTPSKSSVKKGQSKETDKDGSGKDGSVKARLKALALSRGKREVEACGPQLKLAPGDCLSLLPSKRDLAAHLTFTEAIRLTWVSKGVRASVGKDPVLTSISAEFESLACNRLIADAYPAAAPPGQHFKALRSLVDKAAHFAGPSREEVARQAAENLESLAPQIENVVFHFAPKRSLPRPVVAAGADVPGPDTDAKAAPEAQPDVGPAVKPDGQAKATAEKEDIPPAPRGGWLQNAVDKGDVEFVRTRTPGFLTEFLGLSDHLMPEEQKIAWLRAPLLEASTPTLGALQEDEPKHYDSVAAYVKAIVESPSVSVANKVKICIVPSENPAFSASILTGIQESKLKPQEKQSLMAGIAVAPDLLVDRTIEKLAKFKVLAPQWIDDKLACLRGLKGILPASPKAPV